MATRKVDLREEAEVNGATVVPAPATIAPVPQSRLPAALRFPLMLILTLSISVFGYSITAEPMGFETREVAPSFQEPWQVALVLGYKVASIAFVWFMNYDFVDVVCLTILTRAPHLWFMLTFYQINNATILTHLFIDSVSVAIPFWALRGRAPVHSRRASAAAVPNKNIVEDLGVKATTSAFAAVLYSFIVFVVSVKILPEFLITHFDGLKTLEVVHTTTMLSLLTSTMLPLGWCAREFILTPSLAAQKNLADIREEAFNPETATLAATLQYNMWGYSKGTKVLLQRILALVAFGWVNGSYETFISVAGADWAGAVGYSGIWALAHLVVGVAFAWVESD